MGKKGKHSELYGETIRKSETRAVKRAMVRLVELGKRDWQCGSVHWPRKESLTNRELGQGDRVRHAWWNMRKCLGKSKYERFIEWNR